MDIFYRRQNNNLNRSAKCKRWIRKYAYETETLWRKWNIWEIGKIDLQNVYKGNKPVPVINMKHGTENVFSKQKQITETIEIDFIHSLFYRIDLKYYSS